MIHLVFETANVAILQSAIEMDESLAGKVIEIKITNGGSGYSSAPTVAIAAPASGVQATATATISGGAVTAITINVSGSGYVLSDAAAVTFSGGSGSGAAAYAVKAISWDSFVEDTTPTADNKAGIIITGAYVDKCSRAKSWHDNQNFRHSRFDLRYGKYFLINFTTNFVQKCLAA